MVGEGLLLSQGVSVFLIRKVFSVCQVVPGLLFYVSFNRYLWDRLEYRYCHSLLLFQVSHSAEKELGAYRDFRRSRVTVN